MNSAPRPAGMPWLIPYLTVKDAAAALDFYGRAFGFEKTSAMPGPDGRVVHASMSYRDSIIMFGPEGAFGGKVKAPVSTGVIPPVTLYVYCDDVDATFERARKADAQVGFAPQDMFYGDRVCKLLDPDGHVWNFATTVGEFDPSRIPQ